jgi:hypothetical protein
MPFSSLQMYHGPIVHTERDRRAWIGILPSYREPRCARSILEIMTTALPLVMLSILMWRIPSSIKIMATVMVLG